MRPTPLKEHGFTLIELLVVIAIIGLLSVVVLASLSAAKNKANDNYQMTMFAQIRSALELYRSSVGYYPKTINADGITLYQNYVGTNFGTQQTQYCDVCGSNLIPGLSPTYIKVLPTAAGKNLYQYNYFFYMYQSDGNNYLLEGYGTVANTPSTSNPYYAYINSIMIYSDQAWANAHKW